MLSEKWRYKVLRAGEYESTTVTRKLFLCYHLFFLHKSKIQVVIYFKWTAWLQPCLWKCSYLFRERNKNPCSLLFFALVSSWWFVCWAPPSVFIGLKLYLFYNNTTRLQIGHEVILLGGESIRNIFSQGKPSEVLTGLKNPILLMSAVGFEPTISQAFSGGVNT